MKTRNAVIAVVLLLAVITGWRIRQRSSASLPDSPGQHAVSLDVEIKKVTMQKTGDHAHVILTAAFRQSGQAPVRLEPPVVKLLTANGQTAPRYLGPLLPEPILTSAEAAEITLHFWLPLTDLKAPLVLEAAGRRYPLPPPD